MKKAKTMLVVVVAALGIMSFALVGCAGSPAGSDRNPGTQDAPASLDATEIAWSGYTMGFEQVTDDPDEVNVAGLEVDGKALKVCFRYVGDAANSGGFVSDDLFQNLTDHPIVLRDASGATYEYTKTIGDFIMKGDFATEGFAMEDLQPRFSITFDVPVDSSVSDFVLDTGDGAPISLVPYISSAYEADISD